MALNSLQLNFIAQIQALATSLKEAHASSFELKQAFDENFSTGDDNDLSVEDLTEFGFDYTAIQTFCNQVCVQFPNFWTGSAVTTREYGQDSRAIML